MPIYDKTNSLILGQGQGRIIAKIGNIQTFVKEGFNPKLGVLLRDIHDEADTFNIEKEWFYQKPLIVKAKNNLGRCISFNAQYTKMLTKNDSKLKFYCVWKNINNVELLD